MEATRGFATAERELEGAGMSIGRGYRVIFALGLALALQCLCLLAAPEADAVEFPYTLNQELSLTGDCSTKPEVDEAKDPDCPYPAPPGGPSGRFDRPHSVAVDDWGNLYVASRSGDGTTGRIDIFDKEGHFISELPDPHGPQSIAVDGEGNLYVFEELLGVIGAPGPEIVRYPPTTYNPAAEEIEYEQATRTTVINEPGRPAIDRADPADPGDDRLYVDQGIQIEIHSSAKAGNGLVDTIKPAGLSSSLYAVVDAERRLLYITHCKKEVQKECVVWVLEADAPYAFIKEIDGSTTPAGAFFSAQGRLSIAVDETNGHLFVGDLAARDDIYEYDENHVYRSTFEVPGAPATEVQPAIAENPKEPDSGDLNPNDNYRHLFVPLSQTSGSALAFAPPVVGPPEIEAAAAANIGGTEAELEATIDPGQLQASYEIRYVTQAQYEIDEFESAAVAATGTIPGVNTSQRVSTIVAGLTSGTAYRFLVTAENELDEAEPVEGTFTTYSDVDPGDNCPNETMRTGPSAGLPDCRAYELVTPPDTNGKAPSGAGGEGDRFGMVQAAPSGGAVSFEIVNGILPGTEGTGYFYGDPYVATRGTNGWATAQAGPTGEQGSVLQPGSFSPDQGYSFWRVENEGSAVVEGNPTSYVRYPDGHSELIGRGSLGTDPRAVGRLITEGGTHIVFETTTTVGAIPVKLEPEAPDEGITAVYDRTRDPVSGEEETHVVSLLPGNVTPSEHTFYVGASADGQGIAFLLPGSPSTSADDKLYLRVADEVTFEVGEGVTFAGISEGGKRIFYLEGGDLKAFDTEGKAEIVFADTTAPVVPVNVSPDGTRAYFVSETAIVGSGANPEGDSALPGEQNLYLSEGEDTPAFIATVTDRDVEGSTSGVPADGLGLWTETQAEQKPAIDPSRLTPDGQVLVFQSRADLTGYDSGDHPQIYRYDHVNGRLHCLSCPPTATAATGGAALQSLAALDSTVPLSNYGFVPALRADGARLFFESTEALVSDDTDGLRDVYEWEEEGIGSCNRPGGCVYLISSGQSARNDYLFGHSRSGDDAFIYTADVLVPGDGETISIYDARVGGGFAAVEPRVCLDEGGCRPAPTPPPGPLSSSPPKLTPPVPPRKCPRGKRRVKRKGKVICVKKHRKQRQVKKGAGK